jgi:hypothetical protein
MKAHVEGGAGYYFGNAAIDQVRESGWFIGQFVREPLHLRHQTDLEVKWGIHPDGEKRHRPWANGRATTISVLVRGSLRVTFYLGESPQTVTMQKEGDYIIFAPDTVHSWEAIGDTIVLSIRFPSVDLWQAARAADRSDAL